MLGRSGDGSQCWLGGEELGSIPVFQVHQGKAAGAECGVGICKGSMERGGALL